MTTSKPCPPRPNLVELVKRAQAHFESLTPSQKLRHLYMQRRSFARSAGGGFDQEGYDKHTPHEEWLTDTQIGLILLGEKPE